MSVSCCTHKTEQRRDAAAGSVLFARRGLTDPVQQTAAYSITSSARGEQRGRHFEAKRLRSLEVDHKLIRGRRLHRKVGRLLTLENAIDVAGRAPMRVDGISPVGDQASVGGEDALEINRSIHRQCSASAALSTAQMSPWRSR
jgi:hypothetical protein